VRTGALLLVILAPLPCPASLMPTVVGSVQGYFMSPDGTIGAQELQIGVQRPADDDRPLHPLWSSYYLTVTATCPEPISHVKLVAIADGAVLYDLPLSPPMAEVRIPPPGTGYLGADARHGLAWRLEVAGQSGARWWAVLRPADVRLLPMPELRIDWLDLIRIGEVRRLLRECGDDILPGLRADDVPFLLTGDEGQGVLVDHPHPPKGYRSYSGPCPIQAGLHVGKVEPRLQPSLHVEAFAGDYGGVHTAVLPYTEAWCALPCGGKTQRDESQASRRLGTIAHEACHVQWAKKTGGAELGLGSECLQIPDLVTRVVTAAEAQAARGALSRDHTYAFGYAHNFLKLREERCAENKAAAELVAALEPQETNEGFAWYTSWRLPRAANAAGITLPAMAVDPHFSGLNEWEMDAAEPVLAPAVPDPEMGWDPAAVVARDSSLYGACEAFFLEILSRQALRDAWEKGDNLRAVLSRQTRYDSTPLEDRLSMRRFARRQYRCDTRVREYCAGPERGLRERLGAVGPGKPPAIWARLSLAADTDEEDEVGRPLGLTWVEGEDPYTHPRAPWRCLHRFEMSCGGLEVRVQQSCLVRLDLCAPSPVLEIRAMVEDCGETLTISTGPQLCLESDKLRIRVADGSLRLTRGVLRLTAPDRRERRTATRPRSVGVPTRLLAGCTDAQVQRLDLPHWAATVRGLFRRGATGQCGQVTLDFASPTAGDGWTFVEGERYSLRGVAVLPEGSPEYRFTASSEQAAAPLEGEVLHTTYRPGRDLEEPLGPPPPRVWPPVR